jgi:hypothetical protein
MTHRRTLVWFLSLLCLLGLAAGALPLSPAAADGTADGAIGPEYGSTRSMDVWGNGRADGDSFACMDDANRGNLMDLNAYNDEADNKWYLSWVVDSSAGLQNPEGAFFDNPATYETNYILGIDVGCDGGTDLDMNAGTPWKRYFRWTVDYFVATYPNADTTMAAQLYNAASKTQVGSNMAVSSTVVDFRRHLELKLDTANLPAGLAANSQLCLMMVSTYNTDDDTGHDGNGGRIIDAIGSVDYTDGARSLEPHGCNHDYRNYGAATAGDADGKPYGSFVGTGQFCLDSGRPTDSPASPTRQCTSLPARSTVSALVDGVCQQDFEGVVIDGPVDTGKYTFLSEFRFAGPYGNGVSATAPFYYGLGGDPARSDYTPESAASQYYTGANYSSRLLQTIPNGRSADLTYVNTRTDKCFLYLQSEGVTAISPQADYADLFLAIDRPGIVSTRVEGSFADSAGADAPASKRVNFRGWNPDYAVRVQWFDGAGQGNADLYQSDWTLIGSKAPAVKNTSDYNYVDCPTLNFANDFHWMSDGGGKFEVAVPWTLVGGLPNTAEQIKIGVYATYNDDNYDAFDQAPGLGEGCHGAGCQEMIGDEPHDTDTGAATSDGVPYSGRHFGDNDDKPASDPWSDIDTIEEYFVFTPSPNLITCNPLAVTLAAFEAEAQADRVLVSWETASELNNRGFNLYRGVSPDGWDRQLNALLIPSQAPGSPSGSAYTWEDQADLVPGTTYYYWLQDLDVYGATTLHGPVSVDFVTPTAVRLARVSASPGLDTLRYSTHAGAAALPWLLTVAGAGAGAVLALRRRPR